MKVIKLVKIQFPRNEGLKVDIFQIRPIPHLVQLVEILNSSVKEYVCLTHMSYCCSHLHDGIYGYTYVRGSSNEI